MEARLDFARTAPSGIRSLQELEKYLHGTGLEPQLLELVRLRASLLNGCAFCIDMHSKDVRALGEREQRLYALAAWQETPFFSARERAALAWTDALTKIHEEVSDTLFTMARETFSEKELVDLSLAIVAINSWNRLAIAFRKPAGSYRPDLAR
ncbi:MULTISPECIES: carboxymuconolactone decarboxylase family protein [Acidithiobacillus]|jgi:AhpD family alkylhydroperoxidase|uniref:Carboxymuconolactone decarboxylase n=3 Tax=Acidithiobacillus TaxID=119977 RepID=A0A179BL47_ACIFR|nr:MULTISPECIES: carboxymuconolactone decarboxylase family protein [Acidithiobacillus]OYV82737.1 MAG: carboxymuconolactone decarboxylase family protein [Acidithiobacillus ferrivorans]MBU2845083.1 carboxymuconolactone decarboxylase family protein [Acidithiobacillus ferriphilus]MEB8487143.1 carboxymuconolactone decarboxylase family protein [Acidithiobacillus ferriphilus]MEB8491561.1 carboxymuconolactone decarboxylase family protein [Acidithiobacillus ferriphilus]MEB8492808.1 carboxymuconolactone